MPKYLLVFGLFIKHESLEFVVNFKLFLKQFNTRINLLFFYEKIHFSLFIFP